ncbi:hypothetical protein, partial [uncultured Bacteroides sp.]|uniref:hypothetical protein n=1 Tax=uncultured Bacteroides sp. TaxID=162156 RepID=UPI0026225D6F
GNGITNPDKISIGLQIQWNKNETKKRGNNQMAVPSTKTLTMKLYHSSFTADNDTRLFKP